MRNKGIIDKKGAQLECRALSLHRRQFSPNGMDRVENQGHAGFAGILLSAKQKKDAVNAPFLGLGL